MKTIIGVLIAVVVLVSCNNKSQSHNVELVNQYFDHFNNHEWDKMAQMYSSNAQFKDPSMGQGIVEKSKDDVVQHYSSLNEIFPDIKDEIIQIYPSGENAVIVEFISTGTSPDNSTFELPICTIFTFEDGLIVKDFSYYDNFEE